MKKVTLSAAQERWYCSLRKLVEFNVQVPELQRSVDDERVQTIVEFQRAHREKHGAFLFIGDVALLAAGAQGRYWIVDGQHRLAAARSLVHELSEQPVSVLIVTVSASLTLKDVFTLVNKSVPVPEWIVQGTISAIHKCAITDVQSILKKRYRPFWSTATNPRRPNVSMSALAAALATGARRCPDAFPITALELAAFVDHANTRLHELHPATHATLAALDKVRQAPTVMPLFLSNDATFEWVLEWLPSFCIKVPPQPPQQTRSNPQAEEKASRRPLPRASRCAVWNRFFGEWAGVGACYCCRREITQQNYECGHILAACKGGSDAISNLRPICTTCNRSMGSRHMDEFCGTTGMLGALVSFCVPVEEEEMS
ncbi:hypothetical protein TSOC_005130 [Tetrabaena socialis]|uniref:HNH endonuclease 5 domain-containing protein n=1 Tax=Tetrabaena socialis TaxID=47790 RepID=A0A2J8A764_9CHLO|nr:hypothetical protein TSOC_005130 [Tetrabaena socialis]|eukprot:PNH08369.1 hypothetical protein TSOC_005130 [Tetrabaena socialis]